MSTSVALPRRRLLWPAGQLVLAAGLAGVLVVGARLGDYPNDAARAVSALAEGSLGRAAAVPFLMGPFSIVVRAPFAWLAGVIGQTGELAQYRAGVLACLIAPALLGCVLARSLAGRGTVGTSAVLVATLAVLSPVSIDAVQAGHPEELLGGALCVAAVLLAERSRSMLAGIALGLAIATKQWALIAVLPVLCGALPRDRIRVVSAGALTALLFYVPFIAANARSFLTATRSEASVESASTPETIWFPFSHRSQVRVPGSPVLTYHAIPTWLPPLSHALIVFAGIPLVLLYRRRAAMVRPLALLALLFLLRGVLDPVDQGYFHAPFFLALLALEAAAGAGGAPFVTLGTLGAYWLTFHVFAGSALGPAATNALYLGWTAAVGAYLFGLPLIRRRPSGSLLVPPEQRSDGWRCSTRLLRLRIPQR